MHFFSSSVFLPLWQHMLIACLSASSSASQAGVLYHKQQQSADSSGFQWGCGRCGITDTPDRGSSPNIFYSLAPFFFQKITYQSVDKRISESSWLLLRPSISRDKINESCFKAHPHKVNAYTSPTTWFLNGHSHWEEIMAFLPSYCANWSYQTENGLLNALPKLAKVE